MFHFIKAVFEAIAVTDSRIMDAGPLSWEVRLCYLAILDTGCSIIDDPDVRTSQNFIEYGVSRIEYQVVGASDNAFQVNQNEIFM